jgi:hypothetical protein
LANRPLIREQAFGEALDPDKLERLGRYEVHLDRKLERTLAMLLRLRDLREGIVMLRYRCDNGLWMRAVSANPLIGRQKNLSTRGMY